jgi:hypothetical protein
MNAQDAERAEKAREARLRRLAGRKGLVLRKCRIRTPTDSWFQKFWLIEPNHNRIVAGQFGLTLDEVEAELAG